MKYKGLDCYFVCGFFGEGGGIHAGGQVSSVSWWTVWAHV